MKDNFLLIIFTTKAFVAPVGDFENYDFHERVRRILCNIQLFHILCSYYRRNYQLLLKLAVQTVALVRWVEIDIIVFFSWKFYNISFKTKSRHVK